MKLVQRTFVLLAIIVSLALSAYVQDLSPECATEPTDVLLAYGDSLVCGIETAGDSDFFRFVGNMGDRVIIEAERVSSNALSFVCMSAADCP